MVMLKFPSKGVIRCIDHAKAAKEHRVPYGHKGPRGPGLWLVKDDGIYVFSNGVPVDEVKKDRTFVVYARGFDPNKADVDDKCRAAVGGDDFVEILSLQDEKLERNIRAGSDLYVKMTSQKLSVLYEERVR